MTWDLPKALGADPNRRGMVAGTDNQVANYIGNVADNIQASKEQRLEDIKDTTFGEAKKPRHLWNWVLWSRSNGSLL